METMMLMASNNQLASHYSKASSKSEVTARTRELSRAETVKAEAIRVMVQTKWSWQQLQWQHR